MDSLKWIFAGIVIALLGISSIGEAQEDTWTQKANMPTARHWLSASAADGKIYAIGGRRSAGGPVVSTVEEYDPPTDTWAQKTDMPTPRGLPGACVVDGKIYVIGGTSTGLSMLSTVEVYDPVADTWTTKADMPTPRCCFAISVVNGKIYVMGGWGAGNITPPLSIVEVYDPVTDRWSTKTDMPTARAEMSSSVVNDKIYVIGGRPISNESVILSIVEVYDPVTDTWMQASEMPTPRLTGFAHTVAGQIYVIGGSLIGTSPFLRTSVVEAYDPVTDTWTTKADMPTPRSIFGAGAVNGKIYVFGGAESSFSPLATVEAYDTGVGLEIQVIFPTEVPFTGGQVSIGVTQDFPPNLEATIGGKPVTAVNPAGNRLISVIVPPGEVGVHDLVITAPPGPETYYHREPIIYTAPFAPHIHSITPARGPLTGGGPGVIEGENFLPGAEVLFEPDRASEGIPATDVVVTPTRITFTIPPHTEGTKGVIVRNPDGKIAFMEQIYTYIDFEPSPADINQDGVVDLFDLVAVSSAFGRQGERLTGDVTRDGVVNLFDLVFVGSRFGESRVE